MTTDRNQQSQPPLDSYDLVRTLRLRTSAEVTELINSIVSSLVQQFSGYPIERWAPTDPIDSLTKFIQYIDIAVQLLEPSPARVPRRRHHRPDELNYMEAQPGYELLQDLANKYFNTLAVQGTEQRVYWEDLPPHRLREVKKTGLRGYNPTRRFWDLISTCLHIVGDAPLDKAQVSAYITQQIMHLKIPRNRDDEHKVPSSSLMYLKNLGVVVGPWSANNPELELMPSTLRRKLPDETYEILAEFGRLNKVTVSYCFFLYGSETCKRMFIHQAEDTLDEWAQNIPHIQENNWRSSLYKEVNRLVHEVSKRAEFGGPENFAHVPQDGPKSPTKVGFHMFKTLVGLVPGSDATKRYYAKKILGLEKRTSLESKVRHFIKKEQALNGNVINQKGVSTRQKDLTSQLEKETQKVMGILFDIKPFVVADDLILDDDSLSIHESDLEPLLQPLPDISVASELFYPRLASLHEEKKYDNNGREVIPGEQHPDTPYHDEDELKIMAARVKELNNETYSAIRGQMEENVAKSRSMEEDLLDAIDDAENVEALSADQIDYMDNVAAALQRQIAHGENLVGEYQVQLLTNADELIKLENKIQKDEVIKGMNFPLDADKPRKRTRQQANLMEHLVVQQLRRPNMDPQPIFNPIADLDSADPMDSSPRQQ